MKYDVKKIKRTLKRNLDKYRYNHTLGVASTAVCLAMRYGYDLEKAEVAGLLHDCAKNISHDKKIEICHQHHIEITESEYQSPDLLHAKVGAVLAKEVYKVTDQEILDAITYHTIGRPNMTLLDKIVFVADYIEPNRTHDDELSHLRQLAFIDIDQCLVKVLANTLKHLERKKLAFDPTTVKTYKFYAYALG